MDSIITALHTTHQHIFGFFKNTCPFSLDEKGNIFRYYNITIRIRDIVPMHIWWIIYRVFENLGIPVWALASASAFKCLKHILQKIFRNFKKSYLQEPMQENLWVSLIFDAIEEIDSRHVPLMNRSFHQGSFTANKSGFSALLEKSLTWTLFLVKLRAVEITVPWFY